MDNIQKKILEETREAYENQIKEIKEENLENRIDLEAKIEEKSKILQNMKTSSENTIEEMKLKIDELNSAIIKYQNQEQEYQDEPPLGPEVGVDHAARLRRLLHAQDLRGLGGRDHRAAPRDGQPAGNHPIHQYALWPEKRRVARNSPASIPPTSTSSGPRSGASTASPCCSTHRSSRPSTRIANGSRCRRARH